MALGLVLCNCALASWKNEKFVANIRKGERPHFKNKNHTEENFLSVVLSC